MMIVLTAALSFASLSDRYATLVPVVSAPQYYLHYPTSSPSPRHVAACWKCKTALGRPVRRWQHPPQRRHKGRRHVTRPLPPDQYSGNQAARPAAAPRLVLFSSSNCLIGSSQRALPTMAWGCLYLPPTSPLAALAGAPTRRWDVFRQAVRSLCLASLPACYKRQLCSSTERARQEIGHQRTR